MQESFSIINQTKVKLPSLPILKIKNDILGKNYAFSIAFVSEKASQELNNKYRQKNKPTNVLSFSLHKNSGELILCPGVIKREAPNFYKNFKEFIIFLVIHGMLHLKGYEHSSTMERLEEKYDQKYNSGHRHRIIDDQSRRGRVHQGRKKS